MPADMYLFCWWNVFGVRKENKNGFSACFVNSLKEVGFVYKLLCNFAACYCLSVN